MTYDVTYEADAVLRAASRRANADESERAWNEYSERIARIARDKELAALLSEPRPIAADADSGGYGPPLARSEGDRLAELRAEIDDEFKRAERDYGRE